MPMMPSCLRLVEIRQGFRDLDMLGEWSRIWQLRFNVDKCKVMQVGKPVECEPYVMQDVNGISYVL